MKFEIWRKTNYYSEKYGVIITIDKQRKTIFVSDPNYNEEEKSLLHSVNKELYAEIEKAFSVKLLDYGVEKSEKEPVLNFKIYKHILKQINQHESITEHFKNAVFFGRNKKMKIKYLQREYKQFKVLVDSLEDFFLNKELLLGEMDIIFKEIEKFYLKHYKTILVFPFKIKNKYDIELFKKSLKQIERSKKKISEILEESERKLMAAKRR